MTESKFILNYPENSGYDKSTINFYRGQADLASIFFSEKVERKRLFVTDLTVSALPQVKVFTEAFLDKKIICQESGQYTAFKGKDTLLVLGSGESFKNMDSILTILRTALENNLDRSSLMVSIGGGVLSDMTAFAASVFKRGIDVDFVPTTLLSMVDAAVGGKSGCDFEGYKNMVGTFHPAKNLYIWPSFVDSLPENEFLSGLGEAIKTALLFSPKTVKMFEENVEKVLSRDSQVLEKIIEECVKAKALVVSEDFREKGKRAFLNLGHTFGHALEAVAGLGTITHGQAVCWGIMRQAQLAKNLKICKESYTRKVEKLLSVYGYDTSAFPKVLAKYSKNQNQKEEKIDLLLKAMHKDKKNNSSSLIRLILQEDICKTKIISLDENEIAKVLG